MKRKTEKFQINLVRRHFSNLFPLHSVVDLFSLNPEVFMDKIKNQHENKIFFMIKNTIQTTVLDVRIQALRKSH